MGNNLISSLPQEVDILKFQELAGSGILTKDLFEKCKNERNVMTKDMLLHLAQSHDFCILSDKIIYTTTTSTATVSNQNQSSLDDNTQDHCYPDFITKLNQSLLKLGLTSKPVITDLKQHIKPSSNNSSNTITVKRNVKNHRNHVQELLLTDSVYDPNKTLEKSIYHNNHDKLEDVNRARSIILVLSYDFIHTCQHHDLNNPTFCQFIHALKCKGIDHIIPIVFDQRITNNNVLKYPLSRIIDQASILDFSNIEYYEESVTLLYERILSHRQPPTIVHTPIDRTFLLPETMESILSPSIPALPKPSNRRQHREQSSVSTPSRTLSWKEETQLFHFLIRNLPSTKESVVILYNAILNHNHIKSMKQLADGICNCNIDLESIGMNIMEIDLLYQSLQSMNMLLLSLPSSSSSLSHDTFDFYFPKNYHTSNESIVYLINRCLLNDCSKMELAVKTLEYLNAFIIIISNNNNDNHINTTITTTPQQRTSNDSGDDFSSKDMDSLLSILCNGIIQIMKRYYTSFHVISSGLVTIRTMLLTFSSVFNHSTTSENDESKLEKCIQYLCDSYEFCSFLPRVLSSHIKSKTVIILGLEIVAILSSILIENDKSIHKPDKISRSTISITKETKKGENKEDTNKFIPIAPAVAITNGISYGRSDILNKRKKFTVYDNKSTQFIPLNKPILSYKYQKKLGLENAGLVCIQCLQTYSMDLEVVNKTMETIAALVYKNPSNVLVIGLGNGCEIMSNIIALHTNQIVNGSVDNNNSNNVNVNNTDSNNTGDHISTTYCMLLQHSLHVIDLLAKDSIDIRQKFSETNLSKSLYDGIRMITDMAIQNNVLQSNISSNLSYEIVAIYYCRAVTSLMIGSAQNKKQLMEVGLCDMIKRIVLMYHNHDEIILSSAAAISYICTDGHNQNHTQNVKEENKLVSSGKCPLCNLQFIYHNKLKKYGMLKNKVTMTMMVVEEKVQEKENEESERRKVIQSAIQSLIKC